jgi:ubiquinone/menaquinone biosynthesis C-methylase UbiE
MLKRARTSRSLSVDGKKAQQYDEFSRQYRMRDLESYAELAASRTPSGGSVLDVATGPGYFCTALAKLGTFDVTGLDISADLVEIARANAAREQADITFLKADASLMPFADDTFDLVFCSWAVKNFQDPVGVLCEIHRVLRPGGRVLIVDVNHDASGRDWKAYASGIGLKGGTALMMGLAFRIQRSGAYTKEQFEGLAAATPLHLESTQTLGINLVLELVK